MLGDLQRTMDVHKIGYKRQAQYLLIGSHISGMKFEAEVTRYEDENDIRVVRFKRLAGESNTYKEVCSKILAQLNL